MRVVLKPENVTGRSVATIVKDAEASWLKPFLIEYNDGQIKKVHEISKKIHAADCRCNECFQRALDRIVEMGDNANERTVE